MPIPRQPPRQLEIVPLSESEIIRVVGRRNLDSTSTKVLSNIVVSDDGYEPAWNKRVNGILANEVLVPLIVEVYCDTSIY
jgi:hypothetical protein